MNIVEKRFLEAFKASLQNETVTWTDMTRDDWRKLFRLANAQKVLPLIYQSIHDCPSAKEDAEVMQAYSRAFSDQVGMQVLKTTEFLELYEKLCDLGVKPLVVKGLVCRQLYPSADCRISKDEDVLIPAGQFELCHKVFMEYGMQLFKEDEDIMASYEVAYWKNPSQLYIELHKSLFPTDSDAYGDYNRFFEKAHEHAIQQTINGMSIYTLNYTEHLFYLICHAFKHFMESGVGVRQACDIVLFANQYGKEIDWELVMKQCEEIHAEVFTATLFAIGEKYFTFEPQKACYPEEFRRLAVDEEDLLSDMLEGGVLGKASLSRAHSSNITLQATAANKKGKKAKNMLIKTIFPSKKYLIKRYKYLEKYPILLPIAWMSRIFGYLGETDKDNNAPDKAMEIGTKRVQLLKKYGVLR